jgi:formylglycine-generating enzyme
LALAGLGIFGFAGDAVAHGKWSRAAPEGRTGSVPGILILKPERSARVRFSEAGFTMGSSVSDMITAVTMCKREVYGSLCDQVAARFRAEGLSHRVSLATFELDRNEVSVAHYRLCVLAGSCAAPSFSTGDPRFDVPTFPVTHVRWSDANDYCAFLRGRLPTEAEWEFAARGKAGRQFPWGNAYNPRLANHGSFASDETDAIDGFRGLAPTGSFPDAGTPEGVLDLAGNVSEWVSDYYHEDERGFGYDAAPAVNPKGSETGTFHVTRGGSYRDGAPWLRGAARQVGFRCAYSVH